jgi:hypothetical protein
MEKTDQIKEQLRLKNLIEGFIQFYNDKFPKDSLRLQRVDVYENDYNDY